MAKGARGEAILEADGQQYPVLFTNRAVYDLEQALNVSVLDLMKQARAMSVGMATVVHMLAIGLEYSRRERRDNRKPYTTEDAFEIIDQLGFAGVVSQIIPAFVSVLSYGTGEAAGPPA